jgi:hypothetical protein
MQMKFSGQYLEGDTMNKHRFFPSNFFLSLMPLITVVIFGCSTAAQRQADTIYEGLTAANSEFQDCTHKLSNYASFQVISNRIPLEGGVPSTLEQLTSKDLATEEEIKALNKYHFHLSFCRTHFLNKLGSFLPTLRPLYESFYAERDNADIKLVTGKITWGEGNRLREESKVYLSGKLAAFLEQINEKLQAAHAAELSQRANAARAFSDAYQQWYQNYRSDIEQRNQQIRQNQPVNCTSTPMGNGGFSTTCW